MIRQRDRRTVRAVIRAGGAALAAALVVGGGVAALGGHTVGHYPSYYPDEIRIATLDPAAAAKGLTDKTLHAYVGGVPAFGGHRADHVKAVTSLGSLLVLRTDNDFASDAERCAAARAAMAAISRNKASGFIFHPYPVTPYHADHAHHLDRIEAAFAAVAEADPAQAPADGAVLEEVPVDGLIADAGIRVNGWMGPPWLKEGWFHAWRLLGSGLAGKARAAAKKAFDAVSRGDYADLAGQANAERRLVAALTAGCRRLVVGYTLKREYLNDAFSDGIENVAVDSLAGLNAPIFVRTAKLKDYPWNGSLRLGMPSRARAAWNPVAGFSDPAGRLIWSAIGDPALIPYPYNASWTANRVQFTVTTTRGQSGGVKVPADAVRPAPGGGSLKPVGSRAFASAKVLYEAVGSPFLDGAETEIADLIYPFVFAHRWSAGDSVAPRLAATLATLRDRLVGLKPLRTESTVKNIAEGFDIVQKTPIVEVYLRDAPGDDHQVAALAPAWSTVPWHLLALMEEAVARGHAAFSEAEAARRGVPWLDLARDKVLLAKLKDMIAEFQRRKYVPAALVGMVTPEAAAKRWRGLARFADANGHLLVTNGPYRLASWTEDAVVLKAVRVASYPLGFGSFDRYVKPPQGVIREVRRDGDGIVVAADADMTVKVARHYETKREPLTHRTSHGTYPVLIVSRYYLVGPKGNVVAADKMTWRADDHFAMPLPAPLPAGDYKALVGVFLDGNALAPATRLFDFRAPGVEKARH